jgi:hypothetical protein
VGDMIIKSGTPSSVTVGAAGTPMVVDSTFGAARTTLKPDEFNTNGFNGGHYRAASSTGALTGVASGGAIFSARWATANAYMLLKRVRLSAIITTAFTAAQALDFDIIALRSFTAVDTGGTAMAPFTGANQKARQGVMGTSQVQDMRIATTAALGAGTKTADQFAFGIGAAPNTNAIGTGQDGIDLYKQDVQNQHPVIFGNNEGFNIRVVTAQGAVGVIKVYIAVEWAEVPGL